MPRKMAAHTRYPVTPGRWYVTADMRRVGTAYSVKLLQPIDCHGVVYRAAPEHGSDILRRAFCYAGGIR